MQGYEVEKAIKERLLDAIENCASSYINSIMHEEGFRMIEKNGTIKVVFMLNITRSSEIEYGFNGEIKIDSKESAKEIIEYVGVDTQQLLSM